MEKNDVLANIVDVAINLCSNGLFLYGSVFSAQSMHATGWLFYLFRLRLHLSLVYFTYVHIFIA